MKIYFVRHGESEANVKHVLSTEIDGYPLTEKGVRQAETLAQDLKGIRFKNIFTSPILRAVQTSQILANELNITVIQSSALLEYNLGVLEGREDEEAWQLHKDLFIHWGDPQKRDEKVEGGESFNDIKRRFLPFIEHLIDEHGAEEVSVLAISHGGLYMLMLPEILDNVDFDFILKHPLRNTAIVIGQFSANERHCLQWGDQVMGQVS